MKSCDMFVGVVLACLRVRVEYWACYSVLVLMPRDWIASTEARNLAMGGSVQSAGCHFGKPPDTPMVHVVTNKPGAK